MQESEAEKKRLKEAIWKLKDAILAQERRHEKGLDVTKKSAKAVDIWKCVGVWQSTPVSSSYSFLTLCDFLCTDACQRRQCMPVKSTR
jgi:hypothetical protein